MEDTSKPLCEGYECWEDLPSVGGAADEEGRKFCSPGCAARTSDMEEDFANRIVKAAERWLDVKRSVDPTYLTRYEGDELVDAVIREYGKAINEEDIVAAFLLKEALGT